MRLSGCANLVRASAGASSRVVGVRDEPLAVHRPTERPPRRPRRVGNAFRDRRKPDVRDGLRADSAVVATPPHSFFFHHSDPRKMGRAYSPSRKPFLKRRGRCLRYLMRPVPVVRRPIAFTDQLSERKKGEGGRVSVRFGIVGSVVANPFVLGTLFHGRFRGAVWGPASTHSCACGQRGNRTRRRWTSGCGRSVDHTCWGIGDAMVSRVPGWRSRRERESKMGLEICVPPAQRVALVMTLAERSCTLSNLTHADTLTTQMNALKMGYQRRVEARCKRAAAPGSRALKPKIPETLKSRRRKSQPTCTQNLYGEIGGLLTRRI